MDNKRRPASPGPIDDNERLALGLYSPDIFDPNTGKLTTEAIKLDTLKPKKGEHVNECGKSTGLSVARIEKPGGEVELSRTVSGIASKTRRDGAPRRIEGYATVDVANLVSIEGNALIVLDDGCETFTSHAVIRGAEGRVRAQLRGPRDQLVNEFNKNIIRTGRNDQNIIEN
jgi:hypothetical protein